MAGGLFRVDPPVRGGFRFWLISKWLASLLPLAIFRRRRGVYLSHSVTSVGGWGVVPCLVWLNCFSVTSHFQSGIHIAVRCDVFPCYPWCLRRGVGRVPFWSTPPPLAGCRWRLFLPPLSLCVSLAGVQGRRAGNDPCWSLASFS